MLRLQVLVRLSCLYFFSSRRRHTRLQGDWSSDVCSSDLAMVATVRGGFAVGLVELQLAGEDGEATSHGGDHRVPGGEAQPGVRGVEIPGRSEERRVGKECRSRGSPYH